MNFPEPDLSFLRELVKATRQKHLHVKWVDRDGSDRITVLSSAEAVRLNTLAQQTGISKTELLRQAAHLPVAR
jgi:AraC-like DNA-binding protein